MWKYSIFLSDREILITNYSRTKQDRLSYAKFNGDCNGTKFDYDRGSCDRERVVER